MATAQRQKLGACGSGWQEVQKSLTMTSLKRKNSTPFAHRPTKEEREEPVPSLSLRRTTAARPQPVTSLRTRGARRAASELRLPTPPPIGCGRRGRSMRWPPPISHRHCLLLIFVVGLCSIPGSFSSRLVTLDTIDIFTTHEWFPSKPTVYFHCNGDNKTNLPDVKEANSIYTFKGEESWQPLTELPEKKCKRCGLYEEDTFKPDDVFDEWELCSSDFKDGKYTHYKEDQFNATFLCPNCTASAGNSGFDEFSTEVETKKTSVLVIIIVSVLAFLLQSLSSLPYLGATNIGRRGRGSVTKRDS